MTETVKHCPLCGSEKSAHFDKRQLHGFEVLNRICGGCGFVYQSPRMTEAELNEFYAAEYRQVYQGEEGPSQADLNTQIARAESLLAFTKGKIDKITCHLDIGSSAGILLKTFQEAYQNRMVGVEPGEAYRQHAEGQGVDTYHNLEGMCQAEDGRYDLISMAHVLEHLPDPVGYLTELREDLLESAGWLLLEVPNLYFHDSFEVAHLTAFSAHTLKQTLAHAGFKIVAMKKHGQPRSDIIPLFLTLLAKPNPEPRPGAVKSEKFGPLKRNVGMFTRRVLIKLIPSRAWKPKV
jgi:2-polyprenyl-3-methyl-5-hydroxy-6-metoxy-1,4-benzoquinol methylase